MATTPTHSKTASHVYAIAMQKGGVGKTTSTINLAYEFGLAGLRVLVIDLDQQCNATTGLGVEVGDDDGSMFEVLTTDREMRMALSEVIQHSDTFGVDVAPATKYLRTLEKGGVGAGGEARLRKEIEKISGDYDVILIDCPPALGYMTVSAFIAAQDVIAVVAPNGPDEIDGLVELANSVMDIQEAANESLDIRHILMTDSLGTTNLAKDIRAALQRDWADEFLGEIARSVAVGEAKARHLPVAVANPGNPAAVTYSEAASLLIKRMGEN